jgi:hypothetical protein
LLTLDTKKIQLKVEKYQKKIRSFLAQRLVSN